MSQDFTFSHEITLAQMFDGRLKASAITEVVPRGSTTARYLWDGRDTLEVWPGKPGKVGIVCLRYAGNTLSDRLNGDYVFSKIAEYYAVDVFSEFEVGFGEHVEQGQVMHPREHAAFDVNAPELYQHYDPERDYSGPFSFDYPLDGRHIDSPPVGLIELRPKQLEANTITAIKSLLGNPDELWFDIAAELSKGQILLSEGAYRNVVASSGIDPGLCHVVLDLYQNWFAKVPVAPTYEEALMKFEHAKRDFEKNRPWWARPDVQRPEGILTGLAA